MSGPGTAAAIRARQIRQARHRRRQFEALTDVVQAALEADPRILSGRAGPHAVEIVLPTGHGPRAHVCDAVVDGLDADPATIEAIVAIARSARMPRADHFKGSGHGPRKPVPEFSSIHIDVPSPGSATMRAALNAERSHRANRNATAVATWLRRRRCAAIAARYLESILRRPS